jgi:hypothetical protein
MDEQQEMYLDREDYQDQAEASEENYDEADVASWGEVPMQKKPESLFNLFGKVWKAKDSSKVANLNSVELGAMNISCRDAQHLNLLAHTFRHPVFGEFFRMQGEIGLATSASKKGWFTELFVSQKKLTTRHASIGANGAVQNKKWKVFGSNQNNSTEPQQ